MRMHIEIFAFDMRAPNKPQGAKGRGKGELAQSSGTIETRHDCEIGPCMGWGDGCEQARCRGRGNWMDRDTMEVRKEPDGRRCGEAPDHQRSQECRGARANGQGPT